MIAADVGETVSQPAVIATRPARDPFSDIETSGFFVSYPCDDKNSNCSNSCCKVGSYKNLTCCYDCITFHAYSRCTVKSEPAEPEDEYT